MMFKIAQTFEDLENQGDLLKLSMKDVFYNGSGRELKDEANDNIREMKEYSLRMPIDDARLLKKLDLKEVSMNLTHQSHHSQGIQNASREITFSAKIVRIYGDEVLFKTSFKSRKNIGKKADLGMYFASSVIFEFNRISTRANMNALSSIKKPLASFLADFMDPLNSEKNDKKEAKLIDEIDFVWYNQQLADNNEQKTAIMKIVNCTAYPFPYIIFGPPGKDFFL